MFSSKARQVKHQIRSSRFLIVKKMVGCRTCLTMTKRNVSARQKSDPDSPAFQFVVLITTLMKLPCSNCVVAKKKKAFCCCKVSLYQYVQKCFGRAIWAALRGWQHCLFLLRHGSVGQGRSFHSPDWFIINISIMKVSKLVPSLNYVTGRHSQTISDVHFSCF